MKASVESAVKVLTDEVKPGIKSDDAMRFSQAVLNLANVLATLNMIERKPAISKP